MAVSTTFLPCVTPYIPRTVSKWNKLSQDVWYKPSMAAFRSALLQVPGPVEKNFWVMALWQ